MSGQKILLPYNFTKYDERALSFVMRNFIHQEETEISVFHLYTSAPKIEVRGSPIMDKMKDHVGYFAQKLSERETQLLEVRSRMLIRSDMADRVQAIIRAKRKDVAAEIIALAVGGHYDVVVLSRRPGTISRFFAGSVVSKVVATLRGKTVCVVS